MVAPSLHQPFVEAELEAELKNEMLHLALNPDPLYASDLARVLLRAEDAGLEVDLSALMALNERFRSNQKALRNVMRQHAEARRALVEAAKVCTTPEGLVELSQTYDNDIGRLFDENAEAMAELDAIIDAGNAFLGTALPLPPTSRTNDLRLVRAHLDVPGDRIVREVRSTVPRARSARRQLKASMRGIAARRLVGL